MELETAVKSSVVHRQPLFANEPTTIVELLYRAAKERGRIDALNFKKDWAWHSVSSNELIARAENIALGLTALGVRRGERVALMSSNCPEWTLADAGCQFAGIIDVPIYTTLSAHQIEYILKDSGAQFFFVQNQSCYEHLQSIKPFLAGFKKLIFFDLTGVNAQNAISLQELEESGQKLKNQQPNLIGELTALARPGDVATLIYTSGTTGEPKGVMLSHRNLVTNVLDTGELYDFTVDDVPLSVLPLSHVYERTGMYLYIWNGMAVHYAESIEKAVENLAEVRPTIFVGVPRIFEKVYARAKLAAEKGGGLKTKIFDWAIETAKEYSCKTIAGEAISFSLAIKHSVADKLIFSKLRGVFGGRLRCCISGGAALSPEIQHIFTGADILIVQGYGLTETSPVITSNNPHLCRIGTVGKPIREVEVKIAEDGEILARGANVMVGYFNKPEATRDVFTPDGFFKTGDIGRFDRDGFLIITDRKKELFKTSGGKYIAPAPIEGMIKASRFVNQVVLVGNERKFPAALIVPNFEQLEHYAKQKNITVKTHAEFCRHPQIVDLLQTQIDELTPELSHYEKIKKVVLLEHEMTVENGEMTPTLKIKRRIVDEKYKDVIDKIYAETTAS